MIMISNRVSPLKKSVPMSLQIMVLGHAQSSVDTACLILNGQLQGNRSYKKETQARHGNHSRSCKGWKPSCFSGVSSTTRLRERLPLTVCANKQSCLLKDLALVSSSTFNLFTLLQKSNNQNVAF